MLRVARRIGWLGWTFIALVLAGIALFAAWRWSVENRTLVLLDRADSLLGPQLESYRAAYGNHPQQSLIAYRAPGDRPRPIVVFFHGGSWNSGTPQEYGFVARNLAPHGYAVVLAGYRLGEAGRFPAMLEDGAAAVAWSREHAAEFGGDPERIFLAGHSAGAYNAAMLALDRQWLGREGLDTGIVKGMIGLAGPYDFLPFDEAASRNTFGHWPRPEATQPVTFTRGDAPPMLLATGSADDRVRPHNSEALASALTAAGAPTSVTRFEGMGHVGIIVSLARPLVWRDGRVMAAMLAFLHKHGDQPAASAPVQSPTP